MLYVIIIEYMLYDNMLYIFNFILIYNNINYN